MTRRRVEHIPAASLKIDPRYQRPLKKGWVKWLAENWDDQNAGVVYVSDRGSDGMYLIGGQHRQAALFRRGTPDYRLRCEVYSGLTLSDEARLFEAFDTNLRPSALDLFHARLAQNDPVAVALQRIIQGAGLRVARQSLGEPADRTVNAIRQCEKVYGLDGTGELFQRTLGILKVAYGDAYGAFEGSLLMGVAMALRDHPDWDQDRLAAGMSAVMPKQVIARAQTLRDATARPVTETMVSVIEGLYAGRRRQKLRSA